MGEREILSAPLLSMTDYNLVFFYKAHLLWEFDLKEFQEIKLCCRHTDNLKTDLQVFLHVNNISGECYNRVLVLNLPTETHAKNYLGKNHLVPS